MITRPVLCGGMYRVADFYNSGSCFLVVWHGRKKSRTGFFLLLAYIIEKKTVEKDVNQTNISLWRCGVLSIYLLFKFINGARLSSGSMFNCRSRGPRFESYTGLP